MGTNYYVRFEGSPRCPCCGHQKVPGEEVHIGKRSGGWKFLFRGYETGPWPDSVAGWLHDLKDQIIYNEYDVAFTFDEFVRDVLEPTRDGLTLRQYYIQQGQPETGMCGDVASEREEDGYRICFREFC